MKTGIASTQSHYSVPVLAGIFLLGVGATTLINQFFFTRSRSSSPVVIDTLLFEQQMQEAQRLVAENNLDAAITKYTSLLSPTSEYAAIHEQISMAQLKKRNFSDAIMHAKQALHIDPLRASCYIVMGQALAHLQKSEAALQCYKKAIELKPDLQRAHYYLARELMKQKKYNEALKYALKALELDPKNTLTILTLGYIYSYMGNLENAKKCFEKSCSLNPKLANAYYNLGNILRVDNKFNEAIPYLQKAIELKPHYPDAHVALAHCHWALGNLKQAWHAYEKRWGLLNIEFKSQWDGSDIKGKKILLFSEQGLGDALQFVRYAKILKQKGATVICRVQKPLKTILSLCPYIDHIITGKEKIDHDAYAALMSLPYILDTTAETIPHEIPYLYADKKLVETWKQRLAHDKNFKVGICWYVDQAHEKDKLPQAHRSVPAELFALLADIPGISFYSLQKFNGEEHIKKIPAHFKVTTFTKDFDEHNGRFMDTAALIQNLDLVISVDTSIIHLAAGLGKPVWTLLPYSADCRWGMGTTTPWYPTMKLFRMQKPGDWKNIMMNVKTELQKLLATR